ncbi:MAG: hypothetical protein KIT27_04090 [Legionellales bacterium]|nr:hypothetical protein [Legionellales bacterium]
MSFSNLLTTLGICCVGNRQRLMPAASHSDEIDLVILDQSLNFLTRNQRQIIQQFTSSQRIKFLALRDTYDLSNLVIQRLLDSLEDRKELAKNWTTVCEIFLKQLNAYENGVDTLQEIISHYYHNAIIEMHKRTQDKMTYHTHYHAAEVTHYFELVYFNYLEFYPPSQHAVLNTLLKLFFSLIVCLHDIEVSKERVINETESAEYASTILQQIFSDFYNNFAISNNQSIKNFLNLLILCARIIIIDGTTLVGKYGEKLCSISFVMQELNSILNDSDLFVEPNTIRAVNMAELIAGFCDVHSFSLLDNNYKKLGLLEAQHKPYMQLKPQQDKIHPYRLTKLPKAVTEAIKVITAVNSSPAFLRGLQQGFLLLYEFNSKKSELQAFPQMLDYCRQHNLAEINLDVFGKKASELEFDCEKVAEIYQKALENEILFAKSQDLSSFSDFAKVYDVEDFFETMIDLNCWSDHIKNLEKLANTLQEIKPEELLYALFMLSAHQEGLYLISTDPALTEKLATTHQATPKKRLCC